MKVLQINAIYKNGSTGRIILKMHNYFTEHGIDSHVACALGCDFSEDQYAIGNKFDRALHSLKSRITGKQGYGSIFQTYSLIKYIKKINPDVVHLHNLHSNYVNINMLLKFLAISNIPTVQTLHDCWNYTGKCTHYTISNCYKWQYGCFDCPKLKSDIPTWFFDRTNKMWNDKKTYYNSIENLAIVGVSKWIINEAEKSFLKNSEICTYIYNGIDLNAFCYKPDEKLIKYMHLENKFIILGVAGAWHHSKGIDHFIKLASLLDENEVILLVGEMHIENLPDNIISVPPTDSIEKLANYYSIANVFMQLSMEESFGNVVAEAMACGTPVIAFDSTANSELVTEECGVLVSCSDIEGLKTAYKKIKRKGKAFYSEKCRKYAEEQFNMTRQIEKYIRLYEKIIAVKQKSISANN